MADIAFIFPGQGAQEPGMGRSLYETSAAARDIFTRLDKLRPGTSQQCFSGSMEELTRTVNTQPCMWAVEFAAAAALEEFGVKAKAAAGFSLGELTALTYAGATDFNDGFRLVCRRGEFMDEVAGDETAMAAVLKLEAPTVEKLCEEFKHIWPVNYNCPGQITVSGLREEIKEFIPLVKDRGGIAKMLKVGGAFHSPFMAKASRIFGEELENFTFSEPQCRLYSNYTGKPYSGDTAKLLTMQLCSPVRWQSIIENMAADGVDTFVELGSGRTLSGFVKRILPDAKILSVSDTKSLHAALEVLNNA